MCRSVSSNRAIARSPTSRRSLRLHIQKLRLGPEYPGKFFTGRIGPGDPGPELIIHALGKKVPKLLAYEAEKKILMLEKDAVAGRIESQFEQIPDEHKIKPWIPQTRRQLGPC